MPSRIKGTAVKAYLEWLLTKVSSNQVAAILERLAPSTRALALEKVLPSQLYSYQLYADLLEASKAVLADDYERLAWEHGRCAADALLADVYQLTLKAGDVEQTLRSLAIGWRLYFDTGSIQIMEQKPGHYVYVIIDARYHPLHPPISAGYVQRACEIAGASNVDVAIDGSPPHVRMIITWF